MYNLRKDKYITTVTLNWSRSIRLTPKSLSSEYIFVVEDEIFFNKNLTPKDKLVYMLCIIIADKLEWQEIDYSFIHNILWWNDDIIERSLNKLISLDLL